MTIDKILTDEVAKYEKKINHENLKKIDNVHNSFERLANKGLISRPEYDLAPISPLSSSNLYYKR